ncbi:ferrous iron transport protein B [Candidatus Bandiella euplotis]|uniref:Ferrous iron transport protein B n=1 Tax=Candidatus Bandiella euplotis TaxID=1664265 RepID=A0ABZ0UMM7_9RICK|nr:ferrous iron transport protein B [Candidatus Bandiella woodruffii]WPX97182.1 Ferrous iron transport protein B [Candidatus Bandiella woodruffii]
MKKVSIGIIGNPNSGKSTIFNSLTGLDQKTGNWAGVTVKKRIGIVSTCDAELEITDLPGLYSLGVGEGRSSDQNLAVDFIAKEQFDYLINVIDSTNLARHLYLTLQLLERKIPIVLVLNMDDVARKKGIIIDEKKLSQTLNCPVIKASARNKYDTLKLKNFLLNYENTPQFFDILELYPSQIRQFYLSLKNLLESKAYELTNHNKMTLLEGNLADHYPKDIKTFAQAAYQDIERDMGQTPAFALVNSRYSAIDTVAKKVLKTEISPSESFSDKLDNIFLNKILGLPIFLFIMYLTFIFSINFGGAFQEFFNIFAEATFIDIPVLITSKIYDAKWLGMIVQGLGGGIQTVASFIPIIAAMYVFLAFLDDAGYVARASVITNRWMKGLGLSGQSFFPLIIGLGCNVPAIMGTRILGSRRERISTIMMIPFVSCAARLAVYMMFCLVFFPNHTQNILFLLYAISGIMGVITGLLVNDKSYSAHPKMLIELPEYRLPSIKKIISSGILQTKSFILGAGKTIIIVFLIISFISFIKIPIKEKITEEIIEISLVSFIGQRSTILFKPLGLEEKNWPAVVGIFTGILAKEMVVGTLVSLYTDDELQVRMDSPKIIEKYKQAVLSIPKNLANMFYKSGEAIPDGLVTSVANNIGENFDDKLAVFAYLIFILIYFPCVSVFGVIANEVGKKWAIISALWSTISAYAVATIFYQTASIFINGNHDYKFLILGIGLFGISAYILRSYVTYTLSKEEKGAMIGTLQ